MYWDNSEKNIGIIISKLTIINQRPYLVFPSNCRFSSWVSFFSRQEIMANVTERIQSETLGPILQVCKVPPMELLGLMFLKQCHGDPIPQSITIEKWSCWDWNQIRKNRDVVVFTIIVGKPSTGQKHIWRKHKKKINGHYRQGNISTISMALYGIVAPV